MQVMSTPDYGTVAEKTKDTMSESDNPPPAILHLPPPPLTITNPTAA